MTAGRRDGGYPTPEEYEEIVYQLVHADDGVVRLQNFLEMDRVWQAYLEVIVRRARRQGYSWQRIGDVMGISRQAAHARFAPHQDEEMPEEMYYWFDILKANYPRRPEDGPPEPGSIPTREARQPADPGSPRLRGSADTDTYFSG